MVIDYPERHHEGNTQMNHRPGRSAMGIRAKTLLALVLTLGFGVSVLVMTLRGFLLGGFVRAENEELGRAFGRLASHVDFLLEELAATAADYASSEAVRRLDGRAAPEPLRDPAIAARIAGDRLSLAVVLDASGAPLAGAAFSAGSPVPTAVPGEFEEYLRDHAAAFARGSHETPQGIVPLGGRPLLLASRPISHGAAPAPLLGTLLLGRFLEQNRLLRLATPGGEPAQMLAVADPHLPSEAREALAALTAGEQVHASRPNAQIMTGYSLLRDIAGTPAFLLRVSMERSVYVNGLLSLKILLVAFGAVILATGGIYILLIERTVLRRVISLGATVERVGAGLSPAEGIVADGPDEIGKLTEKVREAFISGERLKRELEEARQALERRVEERTRDLRDTVGALRREVVVRREAEAQVRDLERQQRAVIDNMIGGLVTFDENLLVTRVNPAALRLLRVSPSSVGRPLSQVLPGPFADDLVRAFQGSEPIISRREIEVTLADGRSLVFGFVLSRIPPAEGRGAQGIVLFRDLTDERRLLSERQRLNRLITLGEFSAQVAHELRNPLTAMSSTVQYLAAANDGRDRELLRIITESIERMEGIIRRMRLLSREMPLERTGVDLGDLLSHLLLFLDASLKAQGVVPLFRPPGTPVLVTGDPAQLHQALLNLLVNAMQAMPRGGRLRVRLARGLPPAGGGPAPALALIADSGGGIPPEVAGRIFEPFYTTREAGTGLGLPIADKIVREHGGSIRFTSRPGHGACFAVILPGAERKGETWPAS